MKSRSVKIDILKTIAMFMVVIEHMILYTNIKSIFVGGGDLSLLIYSCIRTICKVNVNLFISCSALLLYTRKFKLINLIKIALLTLLISFSTRLIYTFACVNEGFVEIIKSLIPIFSNQFWFITCYCGLYILHPLIDKFLASIESRKSIFLVAIITYFALFIYPNCFALNTVINNGGRTIVWMIVLYIMTISISRQIELNTNILLSINVISFLTLSISMFITSKYSIPNPLFSNESPFVVGLSLSLFFLIKDFKIEDVKIQKMLATISSATLTVYLLHENCCKELLWNNINQMINNNNFFSTATIALMPIIIYGFAVVVNYILSIIVNPVINLTMIKHICNKVDSIYEDI